MQIHEHRIEALVRKVLDGLGALCCDLDLAAGLLEDLSNDFAIDPVIFNDEQTFAVQRGAQALEFAAGCRARARALRASPAR